MHRFFLIAGGLLLAVGVMPYLLGKLRWRLGLWPLFILGGVVVVVAGWVLAWRGKDWSDAANWLGLANASQAQAVATVFAGGVALVGFVFLFYQLRQAARQLRQAARANWDAVRNMHNWKLFDTVLPTGLPEVDRWRQNTDYRMWRTVHINHLNLLHTQWVAYHAGAIGAEELDALKGWAGLLLEGLEDDHSHAVGALRATGVAHPTVENIMEFHGTSSRLRALLHIAEPHNWDLFPYDFVRWVVKDCGFDRLDVKAKRPNPTRRSHTNGGG